MEPRFIIFVETVTGDIIRAFTWCRDRASGIEHARADARDFGVTPARIWAEPVETV
jgi:hypothetical protein